MDARHPSIRLVSPSRVVRISLERGGEGDLTVTMLLAPESGGDAIELVFRGASEIRFEGNARI